jgi:RNA polymerase nonessential primary-like sigma factor
LALAAVGSFCFLGTVFSSALSEGVHIIPMPTINNETKAAKAKATKPLFTADMVRTYLHEIGRVPLLTHEQEIIYGKQVQQMMVLLETKQALAGKLDREPTAAEWAEAANLSEAVLTKEMSLGQRAKQKMVEANLRLVVAIAKKYQKRNLEF